MTFSIRKAVPSDLLETRETHFTALEYFHAFYGLWFVNKPWDIILGGQEKMINDPVRQFFVAVDDDTGKVVGSCVFAIIPDAATVKAEKEAKEAAEKKKKEDDLNNGIVAEEKPSLYAVKKHLKPLWKEFGQRGDRIDASHEKAMEGKKHLFIYQCTVHPTYQRRGLGARLMSKAIEVADKEGLDAALTSSEAGRKLYETFGFKILDTVDVPGGLVSWISKMREADVDGVESPANYDEALAKYKDVTEIEYPMIRRATSA